MYTPTAPISSRRGLDLDEELFHRLNRLLRLRRDQVQGLNDQGVRLIDHAIYCTFYDLHSLGERQEQEAKRMLHNPLLTGQTTNHN